MQNPFDLLEQSKADTTSAPIAAVAFGLGSLALIPSLLLLFILGAVSYCGVRFVWQLVQILTG